MPLFNDVQVLDAEAIAATDDRAGIVRLEDVFQNNGQVPCPEMDILFKKALFMLGHKARKVIVQGLIVHRSKIVKGRSDAFGNFMQR